LGGKVEAIVSSRHGDTLSLIQTGVAPIPLTIGKIASIEIYRGKSRSAGAKRGMIWGGLIGLSSGLLLAASSEPNVVGDCDPSIRECATQSDVEFVAWSVGGFIAFGAGIGALIGRARWQALDLPARPVVSWVPRRDAALRVGLRF
jgi:hypothetical protein